VARLGAKYANPYAQEEDRKVATFKTLADTWKLPEIKQWHKYLGDFWGPVILYMRRHRDWMPIHEAFNTGFEHRFCGKSDEQIIEAWRRGECEATEDTQGIFKDILGHVKEAYAHDNYPIPEELWRQVNVNDQEMQLAVPLDLNIDAQWAALPLDPGKGLQ
jgi:hypothetical protein